MQILNTLNLNHNQIVNVVLDKRVSDGLGSEGQIIYNSTEDLIKYHNGATWLTLSVGGVSSVTPGAGLTNSGTPEAVILNLDVDNSTIEIDSNKVRIKDSGVTTNKLSTDAVTTIKVTDKAITFSKINDIPTMSVIGRVATGTGITSAIPIILDMGLADNQSLVASGTVKAYIDNAIAGIGVLQGGFDASVAIDFPGDSNTNQSDYWYVTASGTIHGIGLAVGDVIIANVSSPETDNPNNYIFLETNRDQATTTLLGLVMLATNEEVQTGSNSTKVVTPATLSARTATESRTGLAEIATQTETDAGVDDTRIVTPKKLKAFFDTAVGGYTTEIGDNSAVSFLITHNLNTKNLVTEVHQISNDEKVITDIFYTSVNTITVQFSVAPTLNQYKVVIKK